MINGLVVHLGDRKTGSTSIQSVLSQKLWKSPGTTIAYPTRKNHRGLAITLSQKRRFDERKDRFEKIHNVFQRSTADFGIISAEHFEVVDPQMLYDAVETYWPDLKKNMRLIAYVRPHGDKILSEFSERVKTGGVTGSLEAFFETMSQEVWMSYADRFAAWREVFGTRFELRPFIREHLYRGDVVADFFKYVLAREDFEIQDDTIANPSFTISQLVWLREMHRQVNKTLGAKEGLRFRDAQNALGRSIALNLRAAQLGRDSDKLRLPAALAERIKDRFGGDAKALDAAFFDASPMADALDKLHLEAVEPAQSLAVGDYFHPDAVTSLHVFADMLADIMAHSPSRFKTLVWDALAEAEADE